MVALLAPVWAAAHDGEIPSASCEHRWGSGACNGNQQHWATAVLVWGPACASIFYGYARGKWLCPLSLCVYIVLCILTCIYIYNSYYMDAYHNMCNYIVYSVCMYSVYRKCSIYTCNIIYYNYYSIIYILYMNYVCVCNVCMQCVYITYII